MISEKIIVGKDTEYPLNGILTLPDNLDYREVSVFHLKDIPYLFLRLFFH